MKTWVAESLTSLLGRHTSHYGWIEFVISGLCPLSMKYISTIGAIQCGTISNVICKHIKYLVDEVCVLSFDSHLSWSLTGLFQYSHSVSLRMLLKALIIPNGNMIKIIHGIIYANCFGNFAISDSTNYRNGSSRSLWKTWLNGLR